FRPRSAADVCTLALHDALPIYGPWMERIAEWLPATTTGDRAEIDDLPDHLPLWQDLTATHEQCLGRSCAYYHECFVTRMRERAADRKSTRLNSSHVKISYAVLC